MAATPLHSPRFQPAFLLKDLTAGLVVFLVALPLCLGVALASGAPLFSGVLAGIIGGIVVGLISGSSTSVTGPSPAIIAIVAAYIVSLGSFEAFLAAVVFAGILQIALGVARGGFIAAFFPSSVIKGLLAAVGILLILKQIPHLIGHDTDPEGDFSFLQFDRENTLSELWTQFVSWHYGSATIGLLSIAILWACERFPITKKLRLPPALIVVMLGIALQRIFESRSEDWAINAAHLVQVPVAESLTEFFGFLKDPRDVVSHLTNPAIYTAGMVIAIVASLESLLNVEALNNIDPQQRPSPTNRELIAQGVGNFTSGLLGGIPMSSVIVRSSVNINAGAQTKASAVIHGVLLLVCMMFLPRYLNMIPLSCLAAILFVTGVKLASPKLISQMWAEGRYQFIPFIATVLAIVFTDLLTGIIIGLAISVGFILNSNFRRPLKRFVEKHLGGDVLHIQLANQVGFLNRAALLKSLEELPRGSHVLLDATSTDFIDPDVLTVIREFKERTAPLRGIELSLLGFRDKYQLQDEIHYIDYSTRDLQNSITPEQVLRILVDGHQRFLSGNRLTRDFGRQISATARGQHPLAVVLSCIDSRSPAELIFDLGVGDIFSVRVAGNISSRKILGSMEYGCAVAGAKLLLVMGHTRCGAITAAVDFACTGDSVFDATGCRNVEHLLNDIQGSFSDNTCHLARKLEGERKLELIDDVARNNVLRTVDVIYEQSEVLANLAREGRIAIVPAMYDVVTGAIEFLPDRIREWPRETQMV